MWKYHKGWFIFTFLNLCFFLINIKGFCFAAFESQNMLINMGSLIGLIVAFVVIALFKDYKDGKLGFWTKVIIAICPIINIILMTILLTLIIFR